MTTITLRPDQFVALYKEHFDAPDGSIVHDIAAQTDFDQHLYVQGYEVDRCYGGREEGDWWYNVLTPRDDLRIRLPFETIAANDWEGIRRMCNHFHEMWSERENHGSIYSVLGGMEIATFVEMGDEPQHATTEYPRYE